MGRHRLPANSRACRDQPPSSAWCSTCRGLGVANGSNCRDIRSLNYIIGPLGSGKTRLAKRIAETVPGAAFLGLDRLADGGAAARALLNQEPALRLRVDQTLAWLVADGATVSEALVALLAGLETEGTTILVIDMLEQGLDKATQEALTAHLRRRGPDSRPLFFLTRSSSILDLDAVKDDEPIILCPANHSVPTRVLPYPGFPGFRGCRYVSCVARGACTDRGRHRVATSSGVMVPGVMGACPLWIINCLDAKSEAWQLYPFAAETGQLQTSRSLLRSQTCDEWNLIRPRKLVLVNAAWHPEECELEPITHEAVVSVKENLMTIESDVLCEDLRAWMMSPAIGLSEYSTDPIVQRRVGRMLANFGASLVGNDLNKGHKTPRI